MFKGAFLLLHFRFEFNPLRVDLIQILAILSVIEKV